MGQSSNKKKEEKPQPSKEEVDQNQKYRFKCMKCDTIHPPRLCPAFNHVCENCKYKHHFASKCRWVKQVDELRIVAPKQENEEPVFPPEVFVLEYLHVDETQSVTKFTPGQRKEWREPIVIAGVPVEIKLDLGSEINALPDSLFQKMEVKHLLRQGVGPKLAVYGGKYLIQPIGTAVLPVESRGKTYYLEFLIVDQGSAILGIEDSERLNLVRRVYHLETSEDDKQNFIKKNEDVFTGTGKFQGSLKLVVEKNTHIKQSTPHRIPHLINKKLKPKVDLLVKDGIIAKVNEMKPNMVLNNLVVFEKKDGSLCVCLDPAELNKAIRKTPCFVPTVEEVKQRMPNKYHYTVFDLKDGFYNCELDQASSDLCCFATQYGVHKFLRLPFGISSAPEDFQARNEENFGHIEGVIVYIDDLACAAATKQKHDEIVDAVISTARQKNIKFNPAKLQYCQMEIEYIGHIFSAGRYKPDNDRVRALLKMPPPQNRSVLDRAMGMFNYVREYIPHISAIVAPLRDLMKKKSLWVWRPDHEHAFHELKLALSHVTLLNCPDVTKPFDLQCDARKGGLGVCLLQEKPKAFVSRAMNSAETNYSETEKELLAIVFGFKKYHQLLYGAEVHVITDHKPLVALMNKKIDEIGSNRLKLLRMKLLLYNFTISYQPGKFMFIADHLSRSNLPETEPEDPEMTAVVHSVLRTIPASENQMQEIQKATKNDLELQQIMQYVQHGWPKEYSKLSAECKPYWQHQHSLHVQDGFLLKNNRIVVPKLLRNSIMAKLHAGHTGRDKTVARARLSVYRPNYTEDIAVLVAECATCSKFRRRLTHPEMMPHEIPQLVWNKLGIDLCRFGGEDYLVVMDYFSKWLEVVKIPDKSARSVISALTGIFAIHGLPKVVISDNVPFNSYEFLKFAEGKFDVSASSPTYANSNGLAESGVDLAKNILSKAAEENKDYRELLREPRATPISGFQFSLAQILFSRQIKTDVPCTQEMLKPKLVEEDLHKLMVAKKKQIKDRHDARVKRSVVQYFPGQQVLIRNRHENYSQPAEIIEPHSTQRSYICLKPNGERVRRNECHIRLNPQSTTASPKDSAPDKAPTQEPDASSSPQEVELISFDDPIPTSTGDPDSEQEGYEENQQSKSDFVLLLPEHFFAL